MKKTQMLNPIIRSQTLLFGAVAAALMPAFTTISQTNIPSMPNMPAGGNRYLLIVETSRSMQTRAQGTLQAVQQLLKSGMGGQLRRGDSLGIWTYNEQPYAGRFPLQQFTPESMANASGQILGYLEQQKYEKQGNFVSVVPMLDRVIKFCPLLTVILISSGEQKIHGTPFDKQINDTFALWKDEQQKAHMPVVTVLRAKEGNLTDFTVSAAPWPVDMPPFPTDFKAAEIPKKQALPAPPKPATLPSLYLYGNKTNTTEAKPADTISPPAPNQTQAEPKPVELKFKGEPSAGSAQPSTAPVQQRPPETSNAPSTPAASANSLQSEGGVPGVAAPAPQISSEPKPEGGKPVQQEPPPAASAKPPASPPPQTPNPQPEPASVVKPEPATIAQTPTEPRKQAAQRTEQPVATEQTPSSSPVEVARKAETVIAKVPSSPDRSTPARPAPASSAADAKPRSEQATMKTSSTASGKSTRSGAFGVVLDTIQDPRTIWVVAGVVIIAGCLLVLMRARRGQAARPVSLITRSLDRKGP